MSTRINGLLFALAAVALVQAPELQAKATAEEIARLGKDFEDRDTVVLGGSTDNEFTKLAWRRDHADQRGTAGLPVVNVFGRSAVLARKATADGQ